MTVPSLGLVLGLMAVQAPVPGPSCATLTLTPAIREACLGDEASKRALSTPTGSVERLREFETAARHYRKAGESADDEQKVKVLTSLAQTYSARRLNDPAQQEIILRELIAFVPSDPRYAFDLAALQERQGFADAAEDTLLGARQRHPQEVEAFRQLAQFDARRIAALQATQRIQSLSEPVAPGERDADGVYRIGGQLPRPAREGTPKYPSEAQDAGIQGGVEAEVVINEAGQVVDARIVKSVPLLDEPALEAVRQWRFEPTVVEGRAVPVRMVVTVQFTLSKWTLAGAPWLFANVGNPHEGVVLIVASLDTDGPPRVLRDALQRAGIGIALGADRGLATGSVRIVVGIRP